MNRRERRNKQRRKAKLVEQATARWERTLLRACASCGHGPSWQILQRESDVWYQCALCGADVFRIPFNTEADAAAFVENARATEAATS